MELTLRSIGAALGAAAAGLLMAACSSPVWSGDGLAERFPVLAAHPQQRLEDLHPYVWPRAGELWLFTCRWTTEAPVGVWISAAFDDAERAAIRTALAAWQAAGLGVRFGEVREDEASLWIEQAAADETGAGRAVVDCALDPEGTSEPARLAAELVSARVSLAPSPSVDAVGRPRAPSDAERVGAAVHELGHALGFQGHVRFGDSALRREPERLRALGASVLAGEPLRDPNLAALYALPSGSVLARVPVAAWRTNLVDRMAALARRDGLAGPFARVGDSAARVFWRLPSGRRDEYGLAVVNLAELYARPERLLVLPEPLTRRALPRSQDRTPGP